jgi:hypothetical protein
MLILKLRRAYLVELFLERHFEMKDLALCAFCSASKNSHTKKKFLIIDSDQTKSAKATVDSGVDLSPP